MNTEAYVADQSDQLPLPVEAMAEGDDGIPEPPPRSCNGDENRGKPVWAVVANVVDHRDGGTDPRPGTKHFRGGAKVYLIVRFDEAITVVGYHRMSHRVVMERVAAADLCNWRVERTHHPKVVDFVREWGELRLTYNPNTKRWVGPDSNVARKRAMAIVAEYVERGAGRPTA